MNICDSCSWHMTSTNIIYYEKPRHEGIKGRGSYILDLGTRWSWSVNFTPRPLNRRVDGPQSRYGLGRREKISSPCCDSNPGWPSPKPSRHTNNIILGFSIRHHISQKYDAGIDPIVSIETHKFKGLSSTNFLYIDIQISACDVEMPLCLSCVRLAYITLCKLPI
jgi:hypothetical protein